LSYINGDEDELTEELEGLDINGDEPAENGHGLQEVPVILALVPLLRRNTTSTGFNSVNSFLDVRAFSVLICIGNLFSDLILTTRVS
jgi:hypothetical protein